MIKLTSELFKQLTVYCMKQSPNEACGAFYGSIEEDYILIKEFIPVTNTAKQPTTFFEFEPDHLIQLVYKPQDNKKEWIGVFHSHPLTPAFPSKQDLRIIWNLPIYVIISLEQPDQPIMKSYEIRSEAQKKPYSIKEQAIEFITE